MDNLLVLVIILAILWAVGLIGSIGGSLINILLVIALAIIVYRLAKGTL